MNRERREKTGGVVEVGIPLSPGTVALLAIVGLKFGRVHLESAEFRTTYGQAGCTKVEPACPFFSPAHRFIIFCQWGRLPAGRTKQRCQRDYPINTDYIDGEIEPFAFYLTCIWPPLVFPFLFKNMDVKLQGHRTHSGTRRHPSASENEVRFPVQGITQQKMAAVSMQTCAAPSLNLHSSLSRVYSQ